MSHLVSNGGKTVQGTLLPKAVLALTSGVAVILALIALGSSIFSPLEELALVPEGTTPELADKYLVSLDETTKAALTSSLRSEVVTRPLNVEPIKKLAALAQSGKQNEDGQKLVFLAANRVWRDLPLQSSALQLELDRKDYIAAIRRLEIIYFTQPQKQPEVLKAIATLAGPDSLDALVEALAGQPKWRKALLLDISANTAVDPNTIYSLFKALKKTGAPADQGELHGFLQRLIATGAESKAYFVWLDSIDELSLRKAGLIHDGGFDLPLTNQFFSWTAYKVPNVDARLVPRGPGSVDKVLRLDFVPARTAYNNFVQFLNLSPGEYILTGEAKAENLTTPIGLVWRINCTTGSGAALAQTKPVSGNLQWTNFEASFTVPEEGCKMQTIRVAIDARTELDTQISGQAQFDNLLISRKKN